MLTELQKNIRRCKIARQHNKHNNCESDWCPHCSQSKTDWLKSETQSFLLDSPQPFFITILVKPRATLQQMIGDAKQTLSLLNAIGVECIGSFEVATNHNTKLNNWSRFAQYSGYNHKLHKGVGHLHILCKISVEQLLVLYFRLVEQIKESKVGQGKHKSRPLEENITTLVDYIRKRHSVNDWWMSEVNDDQTIFKIVDGSLFYSVGNNWMKSKEQNKESIIDRWNDTGIGNRRIYSMVDDGSRRSVERIVGDGVERVEDQYLQGSVRVNDRIVTADAKMNLSRKDRIHSEAMKIIERMKKDHEEGLSRKTLHSYNQIKKEVKNQKEETLIETNDLFTMPEPKEIKVVKPKKENTWGIMNNRNRHDLVKFGKYKGRRLEEMCADTAHMKGLIARNPRTLQLHYPK